MYCVYLTIYYGTKLPKRYIGSSKVSRVKAGYNGSISSKKYSKIFQEEQTNNKKLFKTRILSLHSSCIDAREKELYLQKKYDVVKNNDYMNESFAKINGFFGRDVSGKNNPMHGKSHPSKGKKINSAPPKEKNPFCKKGIDHPAYGYKRSKETNEKTGAALKGIPKSKEHIDNLKKSKSSEEYLSKVRKPISVNGIKYNSIKEAIQTSGYGSSYIQTGLRNPSNEKVFYINVN